MFMFTYIPQAAVLALFSGPLAVVSTTLLVFNESSLLINAIARDFFLQDALVDTFDAVRVTYPKIEPSARYDVASLEALIQHTALELSG